MITITNLNEWLFSNLDLIEECEEKKLKPIILIGGASSSGKSFLSKQLQTFLNSHNRKCLIISTDNYNNGIARNIFNLVDNKYFGGKIANKEEIIAIIKKIIINSDFDKKFCDENLNKIKKLCAKLLNVDMKLFLSNIVYEFEHINFDKKSVYNLDEVSKDLASLICGKQIVEKQYSKLTSERVNNNNTIVGNDYDVIIVEGIYALDNDICKYITNQNIIKNFVDCNNKNLFLRRMIRDTQITNCTKSFILKNYLDYVAPEYIHSILPTKNNANIVLSNNMSFEELRQGKIYIQTRYKINKNTLMEILKNTKKITKIYQEDIYFGDQQDRDILRLRLEGVDKSNLSLKSLIYKGQQKVRKDKSLIRPMNVLCEKEDLQKIFNNKQEVIDGLKEIGIMPFTTLTKERFIVNYKGAEIKIDFYGNNDIYMEIDDNISHFLRNSSQNVLEVDPVQQVLQKNM